MKRGKLLLSVLSACAFLALAAAWPGAALAQCPLCRLSASAAGAGAARALNLGIIVLLVPPVSIFCSFFAIAYRHRRARGEADEGGDAFDGLDADGAGGDEEARYSREAGLEP